MYEVHMNMYEVYLFFLKYKSSKYEWSWTSPFKVTQNEIYWYYYDATGQPI